LLTVKRGLKMSDEEWYKSDLYYKLGRAVDDVRYSYGAKDKAKSCAALAGKTLSNIAIFSGKLGIEIVKRLPETIEKHQKNK
jgi:hypothetical protein